MIKSFASAACSLVFLRSLDYNSGQENEVRDLGKTGIKITPVGLGIWQFSQGKSFNRWIWKSLTEAESKRDHPGGAGRGHQLVRHGRNVRFRTVGTRSGPGAAKGRNCRMMRWSSPRNGIPIGRTAGSIPKTIHKRRENLAPYSIDLYQVHNPLSFSKPEEEMMEAWPLPGAGGSRSGPLASATSTRDKMLRAHRRLRRLWPAPGL